MSFDDAALEKLQTQLKICDAAMQRWTAKVSIASTDTKPQLARELDVLRKKQATVQERLTQLRTARGSARHERKSGLETAWRDFWESLERATPTFRAS